jgi:hypothetical protein
MVTSTSAFGHFCHRRRVGSQVKTAPVAHALVQSSRFVFDSYVSFLPVWSSQHPKTSEPSGRDATPEIIGNGPAA